MVAFVHLESHRNEMLLVVCLNIEVLSFLNSILNLCFGLQLINVNLFQLIFPPLTLTPVTLVGESVEKKLFDNHKIYTLRH